MNLQFGLSPWPIIMGELEQLDKVHADECELAFESVNDLFPALERNGTQDGTEIRTRNNLDWDFNDQTSYVIASNTATQ